MSNELNNCVNELLSDFDLDFLLREADNDDGCYYIAEYGFGYSLDMIANALTIIKENN